MGCNGGIREGGGEHSLTSKEIVLDALRRTGKLAAREIQETAETMDGTQLYAQETYIPDFSAAVSKQNMLSRQVGFVCRSSAGHIVRLIQPYDSDVYTQEPEELTAQWGFVWSKDPKKARPFIALSTSPYNMDECCTFNGHTWQSGQNGNVWEPGTINVKWTDLGETEDVLND